MLPVAVQSLLVTVLSLQLVLGQDIAFSVKMVSVGVDSILLEIVDDNVTTINYNINCRLGGEAVGANEEVSTSERQMTIKLITNPTKLIDQDVEEKKTIGDAEFYYDDGDLYGERFPSEKQKEIRKKTYADIHRFPVTGLDPNTNYEIRLNVTARLAHLQRKIVISNTTTPAQVDAPTELRTTVRTFKIKFKTLFDIVAAAKAACDDFHKAQDPSSDAYDNDDYFASCYTDTSNCTECKSSCYQISMNSSSTAPLPGKQPILCEPCPCDTTKSTGDCLVLDQHQPNIKCKQCIEPYTGLLCNECKNEGIDYYKNEQGECMRCDCNGNSAYDVMGSNTNGKLLKCQAGTGICIDCQFNTTGRHCHECRSGFVGDPMRRSCVPRKTINMSINFAKIKNPQNNYLNEKYNYKSLLLLSAYIFIILALILTAYFVIRLKYRHHVVLKHGPHESCLFNTVYMISECLSNMYESTSSYRARLAFHITWLCPSLINRLRSTHLIPSSRSGNCGGGGSGSGGLSNLNGFSSLNEDDRLNLAENQVFDECLMSDEPFRSQQASATNESSTVNPFEDAEVGMGSSKNPYISLTSSRA